MKTRESGMPSEETWQAFFDPEVILLKLGLTRDCECIVDFGCGYGTFAVASAKIAKGIVHALDIDPEMVRLTKGKIAELRLDNIRVTERDFITEGSGISFARADYVMLFNILHAAEARSLVQEAKRILRVGGKLAVMHWNYDDSTPRGPSMNIRPKPEQCMNLVREAGFSVGELIDLPPYHFGFLGQIA